MLCLVFVLLLPAALLLPRLLGSQYRVQENMHLGLWRNKPAGLYLYCPGFVQPLDVVFSKISATLDAYDHFLYVPMATWLLKISHKLRVIQVGKIQVYLAYMLATLLGCLWWIRS
ncbi:MAG: hypothetical protein R2857_03190 [Vampirovibrionales bacterium]